MPIRSQIVGCGAYLPGRVVSNAELATRVDTTDEWIVQRTGIRQRHVAADDEPTSIVGLKAAQAAITDADIDPAEIDLIIVATATPDHTFPATATQIQAALGINGGAAFEGVEIGPDGGYCAGCAPSGWSSPWSSGSRWSACSSRCSGHGCWVGPPT